MRLWHKDLIDVLPRQQLISQWRECCCIAKNIADNGTPNHLLVNKVITYSQSDFLKYTKLILDEMKRRGYNILSSSFDKFRENLDLGYEFFNNGIYSESYYGDLFGDWHNDRYLKQCLCNLQEKYDCGGVSEEEWQKIMYKFEDYI